MPKAAWSHVSQAFDDYGEVLTIWTTTVDAKSALAERLVLDPLPELVKNIPEVESDWSVSLERVNAESGLGRLRPPKKALFTWTVIPSLTRVHGVLYRLPPGSVG